MGAISLASVVTGVELGATAKSTNFTASPVPSNTPSETPTNTPSETATPTTKPSPTATPTPTPTATKPAVTTVSHTSDPIYYRYGTVQLTVTKTGSEITDISMVQAGATQGRGAAFPYLIQLALQAQSGSFDTSMMSGATFSTDAFMQALDNALNQF